MDQLVSLSSAISEAICLKFEISVDVLVARKYLPGEAQLERRVSVAEDVPPP